MKRIETYDQLKKERQLLRQKIAQLEMLIEEDIAEIKNGLHPLNVAGHAVKSMLSSGKNGVVGESINLTVDALFKKLLLRRSGWITKLVVSFFAKNFAKNILSKNADSILHWVASKLRTPSDSHDDNLYHPASAEVDWDAK